MDIKLSYLWPGTYSKRPVNVGFYFILSNLSNIILAAQEKHWQIFTPCFPLLGSRIHTEPHPSVSQSWHDKIGHFKKSSRSQEAKGLHSRGTLVSCLARELLLPPDFIWQNCWPMFTTLFFCRWLIVPILFLFLSASIAIGIACRYKFPACYICQLRWQKHSAHQQTTHHLYSGSSHGVGCHGVHRILWKSL